MLSSGAIVSIKYGPFDHVGLVTDEGTILHSSKKNGRVSEDPITSVLEGKAVQTLGCLDWIALQRAKALGRSKIGQPWTPLANCEHFISEICSGTRRSPQLQACVVLGLAVFALFMIPKYAS